MKNYLFAGACVIVLCAAVALSPSRADAQGRPVPPAQRSFSDRDSQTTAQAPPLALKPASQEDLIEAVLGDTMQRLWTQTDRHFHEGEYNHTINLCRIIVQGDPHNTEAYATPAYFLWSMGRNADAEAVLSAGIEANPDTFYMYNEMGMYWHLERKDPQAAIPFYEKAAKFDCPFTTWNSLANCYEKVNLWDKAVTAWEKATLFPDNRVAIRRLKQARDRLAQQKSGQ